MIFALLNAVLQIFRNLTQVEATLSSGCKNNKYSTSLFQHINNSVKLKLHVCVAGSWANITSKTSHRGSRQRSNTHTKALMPSKSNHNSPYILYLVTNQRCECEIACTIDKKQKIGLVVRYDPLWDVVRCLCSEYVSGSNI